MYSRKREDYEKYRKIRNKIPKCVRHAGRKYEKGIARDVFKKKLDFFMFFTLIFGDSFFLFLILANSVRDESCREKLAPKLETLGITGNLLWWIKNFLSERKKKSCIKWYLFEITSVHSDVWLAFSLFNEYKVLFILTPSRLCCRAGWLESYLDVNNENACSLGVLNKI